MNLFVGYLLGVLGGLFGDSEAIPLPFIALPLHLFEAPQLHVSDALPHLLKQLNHY